MHTRTIPENNRPVGEEVDTAIGTARLHDRRQIDPVHKVLGHVVSESQALASWDASIFLEQMGYAFVLSKGSDIRAAPTSSDIEGNVVLWCGRGTSLALRPCA